MNNDLIIYNYFDYHTLYTNELDPDCANLFIHDFTGHYTVNDVVNNISLLPYKTKINVYLESAGGYLTEIKKIKNALLNNFKDFDITCILNEASNEAVHFFLEFDKRVVYDDSVLVVHYGKGYTAYASYHKLKQRLDFTYKKADENIKKLEKYFNKEEMNQLLNGKEFWLDADDMLKRGIATHKLKRNTLINGNLLNKGKQK